MARVITFSRVFPAYHPKKGEPTYFVEYILNSLGYVKLQSDLLPDVRNIVNDFFLLDGEIKKHHTIRAGSRWKVGDKFSPRVWSGKPYASPMITIAPDIEIKHIWDVEIFYDCTIGIPDGKNQWKLLSFGEVANNDGLTFQDMKHWFNVKRDKPFKGQIICWDEKIKY